ncbi:MAG: TIGR01841 family phasin [Alphaproteobacteria bacterium]
MSQPSTPQQSKKASGDIAVSSVAGDSKPSSSSQASQSPAARAAVVPSKAIAGTPQTASKSDRFGDYFSFNPQITGLFMNQNFEQLNNELQSHIQENIKTGLQAFNTLNKGLEQMATAYLKAVQDIYTNNAKALQQILSSQNAQQAFDVQTKTIQQNIETGIGQAQQLVQMGLDAANRTIQPLQNRFDQAVDAAFKAGKKAA